MRRGLNLLLVVSIFALLFSSGCSKVFKNPFESLIGGKNPQVMATGDPSSLFYIVYDSSKTVTAINDFCIN